MRITKTLATATTAMALAMSPVLVAGPALAQDAPAGATTPSSESFSDEQLQAFADTAMEVAELSQGYQAQIQETDDPTEQQAISDEANEEIIGMVESAEGISVDEYISINETAAADPELNERIVELMQEETTPEQ